MYQIDNLTSASAQPASTAAGTAGFFTDGNPATGVAATIVPAEWLNAVMMELVNVVVAGGLTPTKNVFDQVAKAIKAMGKQRVILNDTGTTNAYTAVNAPSLLVGTWTDGIAQSVKIANANTGASTYAPDGLAAIPIYGLGLQPLQGGELRAGGVATMVRYTIAGVNSGNPVCVLLDCFGGAQQIAPAIAANHAAQLSQAGFQNQAVYRRNGGVQQVSINGAAFTSTGATTFPAPPSGRARVRLWGGGGGGGASSGGTGALGGGGGAGGYNEFIATGLATATAITVGAGGTAGTAGPTAGGQGGSSSFGAIGSAFGGTGGQAITGAGGAAGGVGAGGSGGALIITGQSGGTGFGPIGSAYQLASGGGAFGASVTSGPLSAVAAAGFSGTFPGGGASGSQSSSATPGADGLVIVDY